MPTELDRLLYRLLSSSVDAINHVSKNKEIRGSISKIIAAARQKMIP